MNLEEPPRKSFPKDSFLSKAVSEFNSIVFFTNPIDILNTIKQTVAYLEDAASHYSRYEVQIFPFEVTFGLFMGTVLSSDVTQISGLAEFVEVYTPNNSLSPAFEYSKTGLLACAMQCKKISKKKMAMRILSQRDLIHFLYAEHAKIVKCLRNYITVNFVCLLNTFL